MTGGRVNPADLPPVRHVIWDWNGTLLDDADLSISVVNEILRRRQLRELNRQRYADTFDFPVREYYVRLGIPADEFPVEGGRFIAEYDRRVEEAPLREGALELLRDLGARGIECSVLSAARTESIEAVLESRQLRELFSEVVGLDNQYAEGKVAAGRAWLERRGLDVSSAVMVGDTTHDYEVAAAIGVRCILLESGHQCRAKLLSTGCEVLSQLSDLRL